MDVLTHWWDTEQTASCGEGCAWGDPGHICGLESLAPGNRRSGQCLSGCVWGLSSSSGQVSDLEPREWALSPSRVMDSEITAWARESFSRK